MMDMAGLKRNKKLFEINRKLVLLIEEYSESLPIRERNRTTSFLIFAFVKGYRTTNSILLLCNNGNGQDAFMLVRTLFELMVTTGYIFHKDTKQRIKLYNEYDWVLRNKMFGNIKKNKQSKKLLQERSLKEKVDIKEIKQKSKTVMQNYLEDEIKTWSKRSIWQMSKEVGVGQLYNSLYTLGSQLIHSSSRSANEYIEIKDEEVELYTYPSDNYVDESLVGTFFCFYHIIQQLNETLDLGIEDSLKKIQEEANKLMK